MDRQTWFVLEEVMIPVLIAGLIVLGRRSAPRMIVFLSGGALFLFGVTWILFAFEYAQGAFRTDGFLQYPLEPSLLTIDIVRIAVVNIAALLGVAAWVLALVNSTAQRHWGWFSGIFAAALFSYIALATSVNYTFMRQNVVFDHLMSAYFLPVFVVLSVIAQVSALVTLTYALIASAWSSRSHAADAERGG